MASVDNGFCTRRAQGTPFLSVLGILSTGDWQPPSYHVTSGVKLGIGRLQTPDRLLQRRPTNGVVPTAVAGGGGGVSHSLYKIQGRYLGAYETWTSTIGPLAPPPSGHVVTDLSFSVAVVP